MTTPGVRICARIMCPVVYAPFCQLSPALGAFTCQHRRCDGGSGCPAGGEYCVLHGRELPGGQLCDDPRVRYGPQPLSTGRILPVLVGHPTNGSGVWLPSAISAPQSTSIPVGPSKRPQSKSEPKRSIQKFGEYLALHRLAECDGVTAHPRLDPDRGVRAEDADNRGVLC